MAEGASPVPAEIQLSSEMANAIAPERQLTVGRSRVRRYDDDILRLIESKRTQRKENDSAWIAGILKEIGAKRDSNSKQNYQVFDAEEEINRARAADYNGIYANYPFLIQDADFQTILKTCRIRKKGRLPVLDRNYWAVTGKVILVTLKAAIAAEQNDEKKKQLEHHTKQMKYFTSFFASLFFVHADSFAFGFFLPEGEEDNIRPPAEPAAPPEQPSPEGYVVPGARPQLQLRAPPPPPGARQQLATIAAGPYSDGSGAGSGMLTLPPGPNLDLGALKLQGATVCIGGTHVHHAPAPAPPPPPPINVLGFMDKMTDGIQSINSGLAQVQQTQREDRRQRAEYQGDLLRTMTERRRERPADQEERFARGAAAVSRMRPLDGATATRTPARRRVPLRTHSLSSLDGTFTGHMAPVQTPARPHRPVPVSRRNGVVRPGAHMPAQTPARPPVPPVISTPGTALVGSPVTVSSPEASPHQVPETPFVEKKAPVWRPRSNEEDKSPSPAGISAPPAGAPSPESDGDDASFATALGSMGGESSPPHCQRQRRQEPTLTAVSEGELADHVAVEAIQKLEEKDASALNAGVYSDEEGGDDKKEPFAGPRSDSGYTGPGLLAHMLHAMNGTRATVNESSSNDNDDDQAEDDESETTKQDDAVDETDRLAGNGSDPSVSSSSDESDDEDDFSKDKSSSDDESRVSESHLEVEDVDEYVPGFASTEETEEVVDEVEQKGLDEEDDTNEEDDNNETQEVVDEAEQEDEKKEGIFSFSYLKAKIRKSIGAVKRSAGGGNENEELSSSSNDDAVGAAATKENKITEVGKEVTEEEKEDNKEVAETEIKEEDSATGTAELEVSTDETPGTKTPPAKSEVVAPTKAMDNSNVGDVALDEKEASVTEKAECKSTDDKGAPEEDYDKADTEKEKTALKSGIDDTPLVVEEEKDDDVGKNMDEKKDVNVEDNWETAEDIKDDEDVLPTAEDATAEPPAEEKEDNAPPTAEKEEYASIAVVTAPVLDEPWAEEKPVANKPTQKKKSKSGKGGDTKEPIGSDAPPTAEKEDEDENSPPAKEKEDEANEAASKVADIISAGAVGAATPVSKPKKNKKKSSMGEKGKEVWSAFVASVGGGKKRGKEREIEKYRQKKRGEYLYWNPGKEHIFDKAFQMKVESMGDDDDIWKPPGVAHFIKRLEEAENAAAAETEVPTVPPDATPMETEEDAPMGDEARAVDEVVDEAPVGAEAPMDAVPTVEVVPAVVAAAPAVVAAPNIAWNPLDVDRKGNPIGHGARVRITLESHVRRGRVATLVSEPLKSGGQRKKWQLEIVDTKEMFLCHKDSFELALGPPPGDGAGDPDHD